MFWVIGYCPSVRIGIGVAARVTRHASVRMVFTIAPLDAIAHDNATKVVIVTGAGTAFSAGFDLGEFQQLDDAEPMTRLWESSDRFHHACLQFPLPMVAAVNGLALAGGFDLAVMCDVRIASESARFAHPEITFGDIVYGRQPAPHQGQDHRPRPHRNDPHARPLRAGVPPAAVTGAVVGEAQVAVTFDELMPTRGRSSEPQ